MLRSAPPIQDVVPAHAGIHNHRLLWLKEILPLPSV